MATTDSKTPAHASNVYLFKNGYGMIVKTFEFPSSNKDNKDQYVELIDPPSNPVHGTFWIQSLSDRTSISSIRTKKTKKIVAKECGNVEDLLDANIGQDVEILVTDSISRSKEWIAGKIKSVKRFQQHSDDDDTNVEAGTASINVPTMPFSVTNHYGGISSSTGRPVVQTKAGDLLLFETTDNGLLALPLSSVRSVRSAILKTTYEQRVFKNCLSICYKNDSGSDDTGLMKYLTFGITWAPSYNLILLSSNDSSVKKLRLLSKAVILNDIENMKVENLFCIVGFPNISKFASVIDPIISGEDVRTFLDHLKQCESGVGRGHYNNNANIMSNSIMTQQIMMPMSTSAHSGPDDTLQDTNVDDLHLYDFHNILLQKNQRLMLPIFDLEIPYKDVYHCKINSSQHGRNSSGYEENKQFEEVWHSVEFENITNFVLTTAPIVITKGQQEQQFIGQDTLTYTSKGSTTFVNLTKALDVRVQLDEKVLNTNSKRFTILRVNYQSDNIEGKISVMNYKSEEVVVVINVSLMGKTSDYSLTPKTDVVKAQESTANEQHDIRWEINVKPKQTLEIRYARLYNKRV